MSPCFGVHGVLRARIVQMDTSPEHVPLEFLINCGLLVELHLNVEIVKIFVEVQLVILVGITAFLVAGFRVHPITDVPPGVEPIESQDRVLPQLQLNGGDIVILQKRKYPKICPDQGGGQQELFSV